MTSSNRNTDHQATADNNLSAVLADIATRAAAGELSGAIVLTIEQGRQVQVRALGSAGDDRYRYAGMLMDMATGVLRR